jgi:hypothetical protein
VILGSRARQGLADLLDKWGSQVILARWVTWVPLAEQVSRVIRGLPALLVRRVPLV